MAETVFKSPRGGDRLHRDRDCNALAAAEHVREAPLDAHPGPWRRWCTHCGPEDGDA